MNNEERTLELCGRRSRQEFSAREHRVRELCTNEAVDFDIERARVQHPDLPEGNDANLLKDRKEFSTAWSVKFFIYRHRFFDLHKDTHRGVQTEEERQIRAYLDR